PCLRLSCRHWVGLYTSGTPRPSRASSGLPSLANLVATFQPSVPIAPGTALGRTILVLCREENQDFPVEATASAISDKRKRHTRLAPSPMGWPGNLPARASSRMRRRLRDKNFPASSASTKPSSVSGSIVALLRTDTGFGSWSTILLARIAARVLWVTAP